MMVADRLKLAVSRPQRIAEAPSRLQNSEIGRWGSSFPSAAPA